MLYAKTRGRVVPVEPGEIAPVDLTNFDPELALRILSRNRPSQNGNVHRVGPKPRRASKAELIEAAVKLLGVLKRRRAKRAAAAA